MPIDLCSAPIPNFLDCCSTPEQAILHQFNEYVNENNKQPEYYVVNPKDWGDFIRRSRTYNSSPLDDNLFQGIPVIISTVVPEGKCKFVG